MLPVAASEERGGAAEHLMVKTLTLEEVLEGILVEKEVERLSCSVAVAIGESVQIFAELKSQSFCMLCVFRFYFVVNL